MKTHFFNLPLRFATALCLLLLAAAHPAFGAVTYTGDAIDFGPAVVVGFGGQGSLTIDGGSSLSKIEGYVGLMPGSNGTVNVNGGNWTNSDDLYIADNGTGSLTITNGTVSNANGRVGYNAGSNGTVNMSGGTWTNSSALFIGSAGNGTLNLNGNGTVSVGGGVVSLANTSGKTGTLNLGNGTTAGTLSAATITGGSGTAVVNINQSGSYSLGSNMTDSLSLNHLGTGTTTLTGNNTFTGTTTISAGTLQIGSVNALGSGGNITFGGGTLQFGSGITTDVSSRLKNSVTAIQIDTDNNNITFASDVDATNTGGLTKLGSGNLTLTGNNTYTGGTTVSSGTLAVSSTGGISHAADFKVGNATGDNGTLTLNGGSVSNAGGFIGYGNGSTGTVNINSGNWTNSASMRVGFWGNGTLNLTGGNISNTNGVIGKYGNSTGVANVSGGTWSTSGYMYVGDEDSSTGTLNLTGGNVVVGGGSGNVTLAGEANATGTLNLGTGASVGSLQAAQVRGGNGTAVVNFNHTGNYSFAPILAGNLTVNKLGSGTTTLSGNNTYTGGTTVNAGTLLVTGSTGSVVVNNSGTLGGNGTLGAVTINSGGTIAPGNSPGTISVGNLTLNGGSIYNWQTSSINGTAGTDWDLIASAGTLTLNATSGNPITISLSTLGSATLAGVKNASWQIGNFTSGISGFDRNAFTFNSTGMAGTAGRYFMSLGDGNLTLVLNYKTGSVWNTASGNWTTASQWEGNSLPENGDAIEFSGSGGTSTNNFASANLSAISGLSFASSANGSYTINGNALTIGSAGLVNNSSRTQTIALDLILGANQTFAANSGNLLASGDISGSYSLTKEGNHTLVLSGNNSYSGGTIVNAGTLAGTTSSLQGAISNNAAVNFDQSANGTYAAAMSGNGTLVKNGSGTVTLSGANSYSGGTTVNAGTLAGTSSSLQGAISNNAAVNFDQSANGTYAGVMSGSGVLVKNGTGTLTLSGNNSYTGGTTVNAGTLLVSGTVAGVSNNATFTIQQGGSAGDVTNLGTATNNGTTASLANLGTFTNSGNITGDLLSFDGAVRVSQSGRVLGNSTIGDGEFVVAGSVAAVTNNALLRVEQTGLAGNVVNLGNGTATNNGTVASLLNSGSFSNSGNITGEVISFGTLLNTGNIGGALTIGGGETTISGTVAGSTAISAGVLQGNGTLGALALNSGGTIAPGTGNGTAMITVGNSLWNGGGIYNWQTLSLNGTAGANWDLISSTGALTLNATTLNPITISMTTLGGTTLADVKKASWEVGNFTQGITGFAKNAFSFNATAMAGNDGRYFMSLGSGNTTLVLNYKSAATWNTGSGNWTTASQWEDDSLPENGDEVEFAGLGGTSTNNFASGNLSTISGFNFVEGAGAYTVNGNALQIGEDGIINASSNLQTIAMNLTAGNELVVNAAAGDIAISGGISGNSSLTKTGNATLKLTGNNTYTAGTLVSAGTLGGTTAGLQGAIVNNAVVNFDQTFTGAYVGVISGTGSLIKSGNGAVWLSGNNSYSGGTTINSGVLAASVVSGNLVTLNPNAFGSGSVNINAGGAMFVPSTTPVGPHLSIGRDLTLNNGTIAFYDIGTSPAGQDLRIDVAGNFTNAGGGVVFDFSQVEALDSGNYTLVSYNGTNFATSAISSRAGVGTTLQGSFSMNGSSLVYSVLGAQSSGTDIQNNGGPNTPIVSNYTINQTGVVTIGQNNTVAALTFNSGGTLNIQSNGVLNITSGALNVQNGSSVVGGGTLVAPAGLNKDGTGELDFTNNVVVTGTAAVNAGLLSVNGQLNASSVVVNPTATLGGAGVIVAENVVVNGNLAPGNSPGTLNVVGNLVLTGANSTIIEIASPTNFDRIVVSGTATLGGTLNAVAYDGGTITPGTRYEFLQAGSIVGEFDSIVAPEGLRMRFLNSGTVGTLLFGPASFVPYALNSNQINLATALDSFVLATEGDELTVGIALDSLTAEQFPAAFDQIMPGFYESLGDILIEQTYNQAQLLTQRLGSVRLGATGFQAIGLSQPIKYDKDGKSAADAKTASPIVESAIDTNWNSWVIANGEFSLSRGLSGVPNYNNNAGGFLVGADYSLSENFAAGLFAGYEYSYAKYDGGSSTRGNSALFGLYGTYTHEDGYYADAMVSGGYTGFQTRRSIEFSTIDRTARANPNSGQFSAALNLGKDFEIGKFTLGPIIGAQYTYAGIGGFTESGADSLDLALGQQNANSLRTNLGARLAYNWEVGSNITLIPEVRGFWMHEFLNDPRNISSALESGSGPSFDYETSAPYRNSVFGGVGISAKFADRWSASVFYNVNFGAEGYTNNIISTSLGFSF